MITKHFKITILFLLLITGQLASAAVSITSVTVTQPKCGGDGSIRINVDQYPFYYSLDNGSNWQYVDKANYIIVNHLSEGTYNIRARLIASGTGVAYSGNPVMLDAATTSTITDIYVSNSPNCISNGEIEIITSGDAYEYTIDGGTSWSTNEAISASPGTYAAADIQVISSTGCISAWAGDDIVVADDAQTTVENMTYEATPPSCYGDSDGEVRVEALPQIYDRYSFDGGNSYTALNFRDELSGGTTYQVVVSYDRTCYYDGPFIELPNPQPANIYTFTTTATSITIGAAKYPGNDNGIVYQDMGDITYSIDNGATYQASNEFTGLSGGEYNMVIKYGECEIASTHNPVIIEPVVNIPDAVFKTALLEHYDANSDGEIQISEAEAVTGTISASNYSITDLTGIEAFVNITGLDCSRNSLTSLDVSQNTLLTSLECSLNRLTELDVSHNTALTELNCSFNHISAIDISQHTLLTILSCASNELTTLDISQNPDLAALICYSNQLTELDVSQHPDMTQLLVQSNDLTSLNIANGNCDAFFNINFSSNPNLSCVQIDEGFTPPESGSGDWTYDESVSFSTNCNAATTYAVTIHVTDGSNAINGATVNFNGSDYTTDSNGDAAVGDYEAGTYSYTVSYNGYYEASGSLTVVDAAVTENVTLTAEPVVNIPDANFKAALVANSEINTNGDTEIQVSEAEAFTGAVNAYYLDIEDLTGIEAFINIIGLDCSDNQLTSLDVSSNTALIVLSCSYNQLTSIDISSNTQLIEFDCHENPISSLNLSSNASLTYIDCCQCSLTTLTVSNKPDLTELYCYQNSISSLTLNNISNLELLQCDDNLLTSLDLSGLPNLQSLDCYENDLTALDLSNNTALEELYCFSTLITSLDLSNNTLLTYARVYDNALTSLDLRNGNNSNLSVSATGNSNLTCVNVDDVAYAEANWASDFDEGVSFSTNCNAAPTYAVIVHVTDGISNINGAIVSFDGNNYTTASNGNAEVGNYEAGTYSYTVTPPEGRNLKDTTGTVTIIDAAVTENVTLSYIALTGTVTIGGTAQYGETFYASITATNGSILAYQWKRDGNNIAGANNDSYILTVDDIGTIISVEITDAYLTGSFSGTASDVVEKADCSAPAAPTLNSKSYNSITLNVVSGCQYAINGGSWQNSATFNSLQAETEYSLTQRYAETATHVASPTSDALTVTTEVAPSGALTGTVTINGTLQYGQILTATVTGSNNTGTLSYQWKRSGDDIEGATSETYTLTEADISYTILVEVTSSVETGSISSSETDAIEKAGQSAPSAPTLAEKTQNSINLNAVDECEYRIGEGEWQTSTEFTGLTPETNYSLTQRYAETSTHHASPTSDPLSVTTNASSVNQLSGTVTISGTLQYGQELTLSVSESNNTGTLSYQWKRSGDNIENATSEIYTLTEADISYTISVEVTSSVEIGGISSSETDAIEKADQSAPSAPTLAEKTYNSINLNAVDGCEYRIGEGEWQTSIEFTGLTSETEYSCFQRYLETATHKVSEASEALMVTTNSTTGINSIEYANLKYYPNPVKDILHLTSKDNFNDINCRIYNSLGELVKVVILNNQLGDVELDLSDLHQGLYLIQIESKHKKGSVIRILKE